MCLGVPGKVVEIYEAGGLKMGKVDFGGVTREACLAYVPDIQVGEYTVIHVGFAINRLDEAEAQESLALLQEIINLEDELGPSESS
ncbi:MAG: HypC/HybG/HupF family hydrogenase formation chaperone [Chloroflexi bacterium]|nr:HypC/HybG/HupF family hydrogenase formation chaperone [Chloroflexota bacterium]